MRPGLSERFGSGMWRDAARFSSPARPWIIYRSALPADSEWGPASRDLAATLSAASQRRSRVQPAAAPQYSPDEYLPTFEMYRGIVQRMLYREPLTIGSKPKVSITPRLTKKTPLSGRLYFCFFFQGDRLLVFA